MTHVRKHRRTTVTGTATRVRAYDRTGPDRRGTAVITGDDPAEAAGSLEAHQAAELDAMKTEMRWWRDQPEPDPGPDEPMNEQMTRAMGCDTPEGRAKYERLRGYREAGYEGPLDQNARIPDPDDPASAEGLSMLADMRARSHRPATAREHALRQAGYDGPVGEDGEPTSKKDLFRARMAATRDAEDARQRFQYAPTRAERDAAGADYDAARARLEALPDPVTLPDFTRLLPWSH